MHPPTHNCCCSADRWFAERLAPGRPDILQAQITRREITIFIVTVILIAQRPRRVGVTEHLKARLSPV